MNESSIFMPCIAGLRFLGMGGDWNRGSLLKLKLFLQRIAKCTLDDYGIHLVLMFEHWNDHEALKTIAAEMMDYPAVIGLGHSYGGCRINQIMDGKYGEVWSDSTPMSSADMQNRLAITLDAKPVQEERPADWNNPHYLYSLPLYAGRAIAFVGGFGCGYEEDWCDLTETIQLEEPYRGLGGHGRIPECEDLQSRIAVEIDRLAKVLRQATGQAA